MLSLLHPSFPVLILPSTLLSPSLLSSPLYPISLNSTQEEDGVAPSLFSLSVFSFSGGEDWDLFSMGCCMLCVLPHPHSSSLSLVYLPSLSHFKAPWGGLRGEWREEGLSGVTIITLLPSNSWALLPVLLKAESVCTVLTLAHPRITKHCLILQRGWDCCPYTLWRDRDSQTKKEGAG